MTLWVVLAILFSTVSAAGLVYWVHTRGTFGTDADRATYTALHTMAQASPTLRDGLSASSATAAAPHLRALLNCEAVALTNDESVMLAWDGGAQHHAEWVAEAAFQVASTGRQQVRDQREMDCGRADCPIRAVIVSPLEVDGSVVGTFGVVSQRNAQAGVMRATAE
ncbi:MAG TPA: sensor histidine kinase, partial [Pseudonocardiaceae bacterium]|nr:sensor histidine kinase [Pseudonocardiaceae bacterium]